MQTKQQPTSSSQSFRDKGRSCSAFSSTFASLWMKSFVGTNNNNNKQTSKQSIQTIMAVVYFKACARSAADSNGFNLYHARIGSKQKLVLGEKLGSCQCLTSEQRQLIPSFTHTQRDRNTHASMHPNQGSYINTCTNRRTITYIGRERQRNQQIYNW